MQETADHLLYPNPASEMVSDEHLQYFEFFGKILGKVCCLCWIRLSGLHVRVQFVLDAISRCVKIFCLNTLKLSVMRSYEVDII